MMEYDVALKTSSDKKRLTIDLSSSKTDQRGTLDLRANGVLVAGKSDVETEIYHSVTTPEKPKEEGRGIVIIPIFMQ